MKKKSPYPPNPMPFGVELICPLDRSGVMRSLYDEEIEYIRVRMRIPQAAEQRTIAKARAAGKDLSKL